MAITSLVPFISAVAHFSVLYNFENYIFDINKGINRYRWWEFSISSSLLIALIAMLYGMFDIITLLLLMTSNAAMILFGDMMELDNQSYQKRECSWVAFWYGSIIGGLTWVAIFSFVITASFKSQISVLFWVLLFVYLFLYMVFPINMYLQYAQIGQWK